MMWLVTCAYCKEDKGGRLLHRVHHEMQALGAINQKEHSQEELEGAGQAFYLVPVDAMAPCICLLQGRHG